MKNILVIVGLVLCTSIFSQIDTVNIGTSPGAGNGEVLYTAFHKVNQVIERVNDTIDADSVIFNYNIGSLTDGTPTETEINTILGTPASKTAGFTARIKDIDGTSLIYYLVTDGVSWYWIVSTLAL
jgi:hypothetical protein